MMFYGLSLIIRLAINEVGRICVCMQRAHIFMWGPFVAVLGKMMQYWVTALSAIRYICLNRWKLIIT